MTHKTITISREVGEMILRNRDRLGSGIIDPIRAALAEPVPPAGGDVKVLGYSVKGNRYAIRLTKGELLELYEGYTGDALVELVDRAHVTRLQVENRDLRLQCGGMQITIDDLQAELTKARELLDARQRLTDEDLVSIARNAALNSVHRYNYMPCIPEDAYKWEPHYWVVEAMRAVRDHKSAPADKGSLQSGWVTISKDVKALPDFMRADKGVGEPVAFPGYPPVPEDRKLPAEQPALLVARREVTP